MRWAYSLDELKDNITLNFLVDDLINRYLESKCEDIIFVGIGTDKDIGDCLGCLTGTFLSDKCDNIKVYGTVQSPIHALNIEDEYENIQKSHKNSFIIGVDACIGSEYNLHKIIYSDTPIKAGSGVGKTLPKVGKVSFKYVIKEDGDYFFTRGSFRLADTWSGAEVISKVLLSMDKEITKIKNKNIKIA